MIIEIKNHVTGIERSGLIASTPHGYVNPDLLNEYKRDKREFIHNALNVSMDEELSWEEEEQTEIKY